MTTDRPFIWCLIDWSKVPPPLVTIARLDKLDNKKDGKADSIKCRSAYKLIRATRTTVCN